MVRQPVVAGQFYPASPARLRDLIRGMVDDRAEKLDAVGLVLPHAGYAYSGPVVGAVLSRVRPKDTAVIICPNHTGRGKLFSIMTEGTWKTPLGEVEIDHELADRILDKSRYLEADAAAHAFEHAVEVQLPFLQYFMPGFKMVPVVLGQANGETYKEIGREIAAALRAVRRDAIVIASSDMTHYEAAESVRAKDAEAVQAILALDEDDLLKRVARFDITMCGYGPVVSMLAAARDLGAGRAELVRYQTSGDAGGDAASVVGYAGIMVLPMSVLANTARQTVEMYVGEGKVPTIEPLTPEMRERAGVFVSIHKHGALRGCIGTFEPQTDNVAAEIVANAVSAATRDPRFSPVRKHELKELDYSVDVLTSPVPVEDRSGLDPKKYGVIVESGWRKGLLLPDLDGVDTVDQQIDICRQKAGIPPGEKVNLFRFEVRRFK
jgi:AmmeMemoRadiSam system protein B/AmmeMemoRadiSam system protein A